MSWLESWLKTPAPQDPWLAFQARCVDSDGRCRESALRELQRLPAELHGRALPFVLARLNDWVPQVRAAAAKALLPLLRDDLTPAWLLALPDVARLMGGARWGRDGVALREAIEQFLLQDPARRAALLACAPHMALPARRWLTLQSWWHGPPDERLQALLLALQGADARMARQALRHLKTLSADWLAQPGVCEALARAHFPGLQLEVLRDLQAEGQFPGGDEALELAFSRHGGTRNWLLFHAGDELKQLVLRRAETLLGEPNAVVRQLVALQVLRALRAPSWPGHLVSGCAHPAARMREEACVQSFAHFEPDHCNALALRALADPSPKVQRAALNALRQGRAALTAPELRDLVRREPRAMQAVLRVLSHWSAWIRVPLTLELLAQTPVDRDVALAELDALGLSLQRSRYAPTAEQSWAVERAAAQLRRHRPDLDFSWP